MTKNQNPKKATLVLSTWGHLGTSGLIGEWEPRSSDRHHPARDRMNKVRAEKNVPKNHDPSHRNT